MDDTLRLQDVSLLDTPADASAQSAVLNRRVFQPDASIILLGCRGAGKRTLGFIGAQHLHRRLLTEDHYFEQISGCSMQAFLRRWGKEALNKQMIWSLAKVLESNRTNCLIECGMVTLSREAQELLLRYAHTNPIIYVHRDKGENFNYLKMPANDAEKLFVAFEKLRDCSNFEYYNLLDSSGEEGETNDSSPTSLTTSTARLLYVKEDFTRFLERSILGRSVAKSWLENPFSFHAVPPEYRSLSFILRIRLSDILNQDIDLTELEYGGDAVEFIIDTWPDNLLDIIAAQIAILRRALDLPIVFHVEENPREERQRSQEERDATDLELLSHGLKLGVEYISLDLVRSETLVQTIISNRGRSKVIGNFTMKGFNAPKWTDDIYIDHFRHAQALGCSIVRFARFCVQDCNNEARQVLMAKVKALPDPKPHLVAYEYSVLGAINGGKTADGSIVDPEFRTFFPVGHHAIPLSSREHLSAVNTVRGHLRSMFRAGLLEPLKFYVLGSKVAFSISPSIHRCAFEALMMPHTFEARQCDTIDTIEQLRRRDCFGGACITAPFKVAMLEKSDFLSAHARAIGAVNIILPLRGNTSSILDLVNARNKAGATDKCYGDNTDWSSMMTCLRRAISPRNLVQPSRTTGLVIGAGGMARAAIYALIRLGCRKIFVYNRTQEHAQRVADHFNSWAREQKLSSGEDGGKICHLLQSTTQEWPEGYNQPTLIVSCIAAAGDDHDTFDFEIPPQWLKSPTGGVVVELAYEPLVTNVVSQMRRIREAGGTSWIVVNGLEVVCEMAIEAFELFTGRKAPKTRMRGKCHTSWERNLAPFEPRR